MKKKAEKIDGLSADDISRIRIAIRKVWSWSHPRRLVVRRADIGDGYSRCEQCKRKVPKVFIDHIVAVGDVDSGFIERLFCSSEGLQALCQKCHALKTKEERKAKKAEVAA